MAAASSSPGMARPRSVKRMSTRARDATARRPPAGRRRARRASRCRPRRSAVISVSRPPARTRASRSRPLGSVPSGWPGAPASSGSPSALRPGDRLERRVDRPDDRDDQDDRRPAGRAGRCRCAGPRAAAAPGRAGRRGREDGADHAASSSVGHSDGAAVSAGSRWGGGRPRPRPPARRRRGSSVQQRSSARGQRGAKAQGANVPGSEGGWPSMRGQPLAAARTPARRPRRSAAG